MPASWQFLVACTLVKRSQTTGGMVVSEFVGSHLRFPAVLVAVHEVEGPPFRDMDARGAFVELTHCLGIHELTVVGPIRRSTIRLSERDYGCSRDERGPAA